MKKISKILKYMDEAKWIKAILLIGMGAYVLYMVILMQDVSVENGYESLTQKSIIAFVLALAIYVVSSFKEGWITKPLKNIMIVVLASLSIYVIMELKFQVHDLELRLITIEKELIAK